MKISIQKTKILNILSVVTLIAISITTKEQRINAPIGIINQFLTSSTSTIKSWKHKRGEWMNGCINSQVLLFNTSKPAF